MARTATRTPAPVEEPTGSRPGEREINKALLYVPPWLTGFLLFGLGSVFHFTLRSPDPAVVAWTTAGITVCVVVLVALTWHQSHARNLIGRLHTTVTTAAAGLWVCAATISGPASTATGRAILIGGVTLALSFNIRTVIRVKGVDVQAVTADPLKALFGPAAARAGMAEIEATTTESSGHKTTADVQMKPGEHVADDLAKAVPYIESGMGLPPGAMTTSADPDDASRAKVTISDPRVMKAPIPWPGPSRPGASVAEPLRTGLWQDLDEVAHTIVGHHVQIMGMTGSGKSIGGAWNYLAELATRPDVAVFAIDITKGTQTLGPLAGTLHRFETTKAGAKALIAEMQREVKPRTDFLAGKGLQKWVEGCGLTYWVLHIEEFPDVFDALTDAEQEAFLSLLKAIRSGGGTVILSLQRSDYSQMPTLARGQLAKACFGVDSASDASFGLSERQQDAGARPEMWTNAQPGMQYLDAPGIEDGRYAMPLRTYAWGMKGGKFDDERASAEMRAHAAEWPASGKQVDEGTARLSRLVQPDASPQVERTAVVDESPVDLDLLVQAAEQVVTTQFGSPQMVSRKLRVSFAEAKRLVARLEVEKVVGPPREGEHRKVLVTPDELPDLLARLKGDPEEEAVDDEEDLGDVAGEYVETDDPDPELVADADAEIPDIDEGDPPWKFEAGPAMSSEERRATLIILLQDWWDADRREFATGDLAALWTTTDATRQWVQKRLRLLRDGGVLGYDDETQRHQMLSRPE